MARDIMLINGDIPQFGYWVTSDDLVVQKIRIRLQTWLGEWILDRFKGMQYATLHMQKPPNVDGFAALIRAEIEEVEGVAAVSSISGSFNYDTQKVEVSGRVLLEDAERAIEVRLSPTSFDFQFV
jgi:hypothetical protein